jgi:hypothetical protein
MPSPWLSLEVFCSRTLLNERSAMTTPVDWDWLASLPSSRLPLEL